MTEEKEVLSLRVPKRIKTALKKFKFDWRDFIVKELERKISELEVEELLAKIDSMNEKLKAKSCSPSYKLIREDRER